MEEELWKDDEIQFARLVAEIGMVVEFTERQIQDLCESTDLTWNEICQLFQRANNRFDEIKANL